MFQMISALAGVMTHPVHLHGYGFQVIDMGTKEQFESGFGAFANATHLAAVKDTIPIPPAGFVRIRFRACNPGYWFLHCHFEYHAHSGMKVIIKVGNRTDAPRPPDNLPTCGQFLTPEYYDRSFGNSVHFTSNDDYTFTYRVIFLFKWLIFVNLHKLLFD